jgi:DNA-binding response OmpR family regulator
MKAPKTVLIVDDEMEISNAVKSVLEDEGYEVELASDGIEALTVLNQNPPDLVLMDVMIPRLSGYDVLKKMRAAGHSKEIPVILMSCVNPQVKQSDFKWRHFLKKPFSLETLLEVVSNSMNSSR